MARVTESARRVAIALNIVYQGLARCFDYQNIPKMEFQFKVFGLLDDALRERKLESSEELLYRHYVMGLLQIRFGKHISRSGVNDCSLHEGRTSSGSYILPEPQVSDVLDHVQDFISKAIRLRGLDYDYCHDLVERIWNETRETIESVDFVIDLPLNDYFFMHPACGLELISAMSHAGIVKANCVHDDPSYITFGALVALALNREMNEFYRKAVALTYYQEFRGVRLGDATSKEQSEAEGISHCSYTVGLSLGLLRLNTFQILAHDLTNELGIPQTTLIPIPTRLNNLKTKEILGLLQYGTSNCRFHVFGVGANLFRLDKIVSMIAGQTMEIGEIIAEPFDEIPRMYGTEFSRFEKKERTFGRKKPKTEADVIANNLLKAKFDIIVSPKVIYREFLELHRFFYPEVRRRWQYLLNDASIERNGGLAMKQLLAGNLDFMNLVS